MLLSAAAAKSHKEFLTCAIEPSSNYAMENPQITQQKCLKLRNRNASNCAIKCLDICVYQFFIVILHSILDSGTNILYYE